MIELIFNSDYHILKAFDLQKVEGSDTEIVVDKIPEIKPITKDGKFYKRDDVILKPGDWVVVGLASSPDIDLVDDAILDVEETFGDSIEEFLKNGRIFYEHGYKLAGKTDPSHMYDVPIGIPLAVQIGKNFLYVWTLLDKNHPLAQKVYKAISNKDERFKKTMGMSIGAIPVGKSRREYVNGKLVNVPPKMRLYEVSFTGQPINTATWTEVVKNAIFSMYNDFDQEEFEMKEKKIKALEEEEKKMPEEDLGEEKEEMTEEMTDDTEGGEDKGSAEGLMEALLGGEDQSGAQEQKVVPLEGEGLQQAPPPSAEVPVADLAPGGGEDTFNDLVLDKLDVLQEKLNKLEEVLTKLNLIEENEHQMDIDEGLLEEKQEEEKLDQLTKSLESMQDYMEILVTNVQKTLATTKDLFEKLEELNTTLQKSLKEVKEDITKSFSSNLSENQPVVKSSVKLGVNREHPELGAVTSPSEFEAKIKSIYSSKPKLATLKSLYEEYIRFRGTPIEIQRKKDEIYAKAKKELDLTEDELDRIFKEIKKNYSKV